MPKKGRHPKDPGRFVQIGRRIRDARIEAGLTIDEAAKRAHISPRTWSRYEAGESEAVTRHLDVIAEAVGSIPEALSFGQEAAIRALAVQVEQLTRELRAMRNAGGV